MVHHEEPFYIGDEVHNIIVGHLPSLLWACSDLHNHLTPKGSMFLKKGYMFTNPSMNSGYKQTGSMNQLDTEKMALFR